MEKFGQYLAQRRKEKGISQKDLASRLKKEGEDSPISQQYLNDIEHDRRNPPSDYLLSQLARELDLEKDYLIWLAGRIPQDIQGIEVDSKKVMELMKAFRKHK